MRLPRSWMKKMSLTSCTGRASHTPEPKACTTRVAMSPLNDVACPAPTRPAMN